jgi:hypothetical protein
MRRLHHFGRARLLPSLALLAIFGTAHDGAAVEVDAAATNCTARRCCTCPNDYCPKPLPCVPCAPLGKCDCYCPKPLPCPPCPLRYCGPNDYCPKPCCLYLPPCWPAWYSCGSLECERTTKQ